MQRIYENKHVRPVRIHTTEEVYEGLVTLSLQRRTLDELNATSRVFLPLDAPTVVSGDLAVAPSQLAIHKASIIFVFELGDIPNQSCLSGMERGRYSRSMLSMRVHGYKIEGYVHWIEGSRALGRLYQPGQPFIAFTAASVIGAGLEIAVPFLAVNRDRISRAQEVMKLSATMETAKASSSTLPPAIQRT